MRPLGVAALATVVSLLASCAPNVRTVSQSFATVGGADDFAQESRARDVVVTVRGTGFGLDEKALDAAVVARMQGQAWGANPRFTLARGENASSIYSVTMVVSGRGAANGLALCARPDSLEPATATAGGPLHMTGALCRFDKAVTSVEGYADAVTSVDDPSFGGLVAAMIRDLTREQRPNRFKRDD